MSDAKFNLDELTAKYLEKRDLAMARVQEIINDPEFEPLDEDGYPTEDSLEVIEKWDGDLKGWFAFIKSIWHLASWGWRDGEVPYKYDETQIVHLYEISTAGWSGNESIIRSMQRNQSYCWDFCWVSSHRGGHYTFEIKNDE